MGRVSIGCGCDGGRGGLVERVLGTSFGRARASVGANLFLNGVTKVELTV